MKRILKILMIVLLICSTGVVTDHVNAEESSEVPEFHGNPEFNGTFDREKIVLPLKETQIVKPAAETNDVIPLAGKAYAILLENGDFIFFRSEEELEDGVQQEVTINSENYSGIVYAGIEELDLGIFGDDTNPGWFNHNEDVSKVYVAEGHTIRPVSTANWFNTFIDLTSFNASGFDLSNCYDISFMFSGCTSLEELDLTALDTSSVVLMLGTFEKCQALVKLNVSNWNTKNLWIMEAMFYDCESLESLDLSSFDTSGVEYMDYMFGDCKSLESLDLGELDTSNVKNMEYMFGDCESLESLYLGSFDTSNVENMSAMFYFCLNLTELDLSNFNTENVTLMDHMFTQDVYLEDLDISNFDTSNVTDMSYMFAVCESLRELDLSHFDTSKTEDMTGMFYYCDYTVNLDLSSFDMKSVRHMEGMFHVCDRLYTVKLGEGWTSWFDYAYLPEGSWRHLDSGVIKSETLLYEDYTKNIPAWCGVWTRRKVYRLAGTDRIDTAIKTASEYLRILGEEKFEAVILAYAWNFPDALAGSYLAAEYHAPVLLIDKGSASKVNTYIKNNLSESGTVFVLGGTAAVSDSWIKSLEGIKVERLAGDDRFQTNLKILEKVGVDGESILVCGAWGFADSLSAGATGLPVLLVSTKLTSAQKEFLSQHTDSKIYIVGGTSAVSEAVRDEINEIVPVTDRIAGSDRYETSVKIAETFFEPGSVDNAVLAYAWTFPDGLSSGPLAYILEAPILLVDKKNYSLAAKYCAYYGTASGYIMGGSSLVTDNAAANIFSLVSPKEITLK